MELELFLLFVLIVLSAFFSGTETALISLSDAKVNSLLKKKRIGSKSLHRLKSNPKKMIITVLLGNNLVNIGASVLAASIFMNIFGSAGLGVATGLMTFLVLVFGEIVPKTFAANNAEKFALTVAKPLEFFGLIFLPIIFILEKLIDYAFKDYVSRKAALVSEDELKEMIEIGVKEKVLEKKEKELIEGILEFNDIKVRDVMVPRVKMFSLDANLLVDDALKHVAEVSFSRIPVFEENVDNIVGIVHIRDMLEDISSNRTKSSLKKISRKPLFVSEESIISDVFKKFQKKRIHLAIVVDEFGGTAGIVTLEDVMEEIVGDIIDETDTLSKNIHLLNDKAIIANGSTEIDEINDFFKTDIPIEEHYHTLNAFLLHKMNGLQPKNSKIQVKKLVFSIEDVSDKEILKIKISRAN